MVNSGLYNLYNHLPQSLRGAPHCNLKSYATPLATQAGFLPEFAAPPVFQATI